MQSTNNHVWWTICESLAQRRKVKSVRTIVTAIPSVGFLALAGCRYDVHHWIHLQTLMNRKTNAIRGATAEMLRQHADRALVRERLRRLHTCWLRLHHVESRWVFVFTPLLLLVPLAVRQRRFPVYCAYLYLSTVPAFANVALHNLRTDSQEWCQTCPSGSCICPYPRPTTWVTQFVIGSYIGVLWGVIMLCLFEKFLKYLQPPWGVIIYMVLAYCGSFFVYVCCDRINMNSVRHELLHGLTWPGRFLYVVVFRFRDVCNFVSLFFTRVRSRHRRSWWI